MKSFKEYLREVLLFEATEKHFAHIPGFDANNPEHKDMVDAYNKSGFPTSHTSKLKTLGDLKAKVAPKMQEIAQSRKQEADDNAAIARGDAELVHHDPENGVKVYKVRNQKGGCAVGRGTKWCIANKNSEDDMVKHYDPSGNSSHVIHLDKEKGNLSRIGIVGVNYLKPHKFGTGGNFQDKGNVTVSDRDWNHVRKKYNLDSIPELHGVRGIAPNADDEAKMAVERDKINGHINSTNPEDRAWAGGHPLATKEHIDKALNDKDNQVRMAAAGNQNATKEHIDKALNDKDNQVRMGAAENPNATKEHLDKAINDVSSGVRGNAAFHPNATKEHIDRALNDTDSGVRLLATYNQNATSKHLDKALNDSNLYVRMYAAGHPNATSENIHKALNDKDSLVRSSAAAHKNATSEDIDKALSDEHVDVRRAAAKNPNATKEHLDKAIKDSDEHVRSSVISHPNATKEHLQIALNDDSNFLRHLAHDRLQKLSGES